MYREQMLNMKLHIYILQVVSCFIPRETNILSRQPNNSRKYIHLEVWETQNVTGFFLFKVSRWCHIYKQTKHRCKADLPQNFPLFIFITQSLFVISALFVCNFIGSKSFLVKNKTNFVECVKTRLFQSFPVTVRYE